MSEDYIGINKITNIPKTAKLEEVIFQFFFLLNENACRPVLL